MYISWSGSSCPLSPGQFGILVYEERGKLGQLVSSCLMNSKFLAIIQLHPHCYFIVPSASQGFENVNGNLAIDNPGAGSSFPLSQWWYDYFLIMAVQILILQVFFSSYIFKANVMVQVATQQAANPVSSLRVENSTLLFWPVKHMVSFHVQNMTEMGRKLNRDLFTDNISKLGCVAKQSLTHVLHE